MAFKLCLNVSTIKTTPLLEKIRLAGKHGFDGIELWINDVYEYIGQGGEVSDVEKALQDANLFVPCMSMELAQRFGAKWIVATPPRDPADLGVITRRYGDLLDIGRQVGIRPAMEYISFFNSVRSLDQAWQIVQDVNDPDATLLLDAFHTWNAGGDLDDVRAIPVEKIAHYHFDDGHPTIPRGEQTDPNRVMPGQGPIDLHAEIAVFKEKGYDGTVSLELFSKELWDRDPDDVVKESIDVMREYFG
ncbi:MAG: sugar phosphate isomerase/epimerase family protein [Planctomycetota bacterium]|jgi:sugar phosphate isomerase/epimerase